MGAEALFAVPYVYKLLGESIAGINKLRTLELCVYAESVMPTELGNELVDQGIKLISLYAGTDFGLLMSSQRDHATDKEWEWSRISDRVGPFVAFEDRYDNQWEIIVLEGWK